MDKKIFSKKRYFQLLRVLFWIIFLFFIFLGIWGIFYEDDMPLVAFFYAGITAGIYWLIKKIINKSSTKLRENEFAQVKGS